MRVSWLWAAMRLRGYWEGFGKGLMIGQGVSVLPGCCVVGINEKRPRLPGAAYVLQDA